MNEKVASRLVVNMCTPVKQYIFKVKSYYLIMTVVSYWGWLMFQRLRSWKQMNIIMLLHNTCTLFYVSGSCGFLKIECCMVDCTEWNRKTFSTWVINWIFWSVQFFSLVRVPLISPLQRQILLLLQRKQSVHTCFPGMDQLCRFES